MNASTIFPTFTGSRSSITGTQRSADGLETELIVRAFERDFAVNGPSIVRTARTLLAGWKRYKNHPDPRIRRRFAWEGRGLATVYPAMVAAAQLSLPRQSNLTREDGCGSPGLAPRVRTEIAALRRRGAGGTRTGKCAAKRNGSRGDGPTNRRLSERNEAAQRLASPDGPQATLCQPLTCRGAGLPIVAATSANLSESLAVG